MDKTNVYFTNKYQTSRAMTTRKQGGRIHKKAENTRQAKTWDNRQRSEMEEVVEKQLQVFEVTIREMHEESWKGDEGVCRKKEKKERKKEGNPSRKLLFTHHHQIFLRLLVPPEFLCHLPEQRRDATTDIRARVEVQVLDTLVPIAPFLQAFQESTVESNLLGSRVHEGHPRERQRLQLFGDEWRRVFDAGSEDMRKVNGASEVGIEDANFRHSVENLSPSIGAYRELAADV